MKLELDLDSDPDPHSEKWLDTDPDLYLSECGSTALVNITVLIYRLWYVIHFCF